MTDKAFAVGDRVSYILPKGNGRKEMMLLPATVVNITPKRIVIRLDGSKNHRNVLAWSLTTSSSRAIASGGAQ